MKIAGKTIIERRRNSRPKLPPITIVLDGRSYETTEWSFGGFLIDRYIADDRVGDTVYVTIRVVVGTQKFDYEAEARVVRVDRHRLQMAAEFVDLDAEAVNTLDGWMTGRLKRAVKKKAEQEALHAAKTKRKRMLRMLGGKKPA
jgi:hypothetical protein